MDKNIKKIAKAGIIAALYAAVSLLLRPLSFGIFQIRAAEALSLLVLYTAAAPWGLFVGCLITNIFSPFGLLDMVCGSMATLLAALIARKTSNKYLAGASFVIVNALVIGFVVCFEAFSLRAYLPAAGYIAVEEALSVYAIGLPLTFLIEKNRKLYELIAD